MVYGQELCASTGGSTGQWGVTGDEHHIGIWMRREPSGEVSKLGGRPVDGQGGSVQAQVAVLATVEARLR